MPAIKNILIFLVIGAIMVSVYFFYIKGSSDETATLVSSSGEPAVSSGAAIDKSESEELARNFLNLLLSVNRIELNDAIFSDIAFTSLRDANVVLIPHGNEGRVNPFAPIGHDAADAPPQQANIEIETETDNEVSTSQ
jgi:hypothetical protein